MRSAVSSSSSLASLLVSLLSSSLLVGCGDDASHDHPDASPTDAAGSIPVTIDFAARIGGEPFACGQSYTGIGSTRSTYVASDFRFYVHDVRLVGDHGEVAVELDEGPFQSDGIALLDFETGGAGCQMGSTSTHTAITGTAPEGTYTGVAFKVGVPFEKNHLDVATASPPLDVPALFWAWSSGYKFVKIDGAVAGAGFNLHVGSTGCGATGTTPPDEPCASPNITEVVLADFTPGTSVVVADVAPVLADVDVSTNTENTAPGCMSFPGDPECVTIFPKLGLPYGETPAGTQLLFTVE
jgi:uncharacterized repeat protein (TIGR04052 family)